MELFKIKGRRDMGSRSEDIPRELVFYPLYKTYGCILEEKNE